MSDEDWEMFVLYWYFVRSEEEAIIKEERNLFEKRNNEQMSLKIIEEKKEGKDCSEERGDENQDKLIYEPEIELSNKNLSHYSPAQRIYLDRLECSSGEYKSENGEYSAYAGGLLLVPLLGRYNFAPTIERIIKIKTNEGYNLRELCLTLFYFDIFGFQSIENFKTVYPEEFGILIGKMNSPSILTLRE